MVALTKEIHLVRRKLKRIYRCVRIYKTKNVKWE